MQKTQLFLFFALSIFIVANNSYGKIDAKKNNEWLAVDLELKEVINNEIFGTIEDGIETTVDYNIELYTKKGDKYISSKKIEYNLSYNTEKKEFNIVSSIKETLAVKTREELQKRVCTLKETKVESLNKLKTDESYYIRANTVVNALEEKDIKKLLKDTEEKGPLNSIFNFFVGLFTPKGIEIPWEKSDFFTVDSLK